MHDEANFEAQLVALPAADLTECIVIAWAAHCGSRDLVDRGAVWALWTQEQPSVRAQGEALAPWIAWAQGLPAVIEDSGILREWLRLTDGR
jgi:hypothetical protein